MTKQFHITDVISAYSGILVSDRGLDGPWEVLDYLTGARLFTHQLPRASEECHGYLERAHPFLATLDYSAISPETYEAWRDAVLAEHGEMLKLSPMPPDAHEHRHPLEEMRALMAGKPIVLLSAERMRRGYILPRERGYSRAHWRIVERDRLRHQLGGL